MPPRNLPPSPREISRVPIFLVSRPCVPRDWLLTLDRVWLARVLVTRVVQDTLLPLSYGTRIRGLTSAICAPRLLSSSRRTSSLPSDLPPRSFVVRLASAWFLVSFRRFRAFRFVRPSFRVSVRLISLERLSWEREGTAHIASVSQSIPHSYCLTSHVSIVEAMHGSA